VRSRRAILIALVLFARATALNAARDFVLPQASPATSYPAHDQHTQEGVTFAADPYDLPDKEASVFSIRFLEHGLLPVFLVVTNDSDNPIALTSMKLQLITADKVKINPATEEDIYRAIQRSIKRPDSPRTSPVPLPRRAPKPTVRGSERDEVDGAMFRARAVEPHKTRSGFVFFDVSGISRPLSGARLYATGVKNGDGDELWYFEIPMEKYLSTPVR